MQVKTCAFFMHKGGLFMWEKVNVTEDRKLIRASDGKQIGKVVLSVINRVDLSVFKVDGKLVDVHQGYIDEQGEFHKLCDAIGCNFECLNKHSPDCRYQLKGEKTQGWYIEV